MWLWLCPFSKHIISSSTTDFVQVCWIGPFLPSLPVDLLCISWNTGQTLPPAELFLIFPLKVNEWLSLWCLIWVLIRPLLTVYITFYWIADSNGHLLVLGRGEFFADAPCICYSCSHLACWGGGHDVFLCPLSSYMARLVSLAWHLTCLQFLGTLSPKTPSQWEVKIFQRQGHDCKWMRTSTAFPSLFS